MDAKTLTALQGSIKKWEAIVAGKGADRGAKNCPLCAAFINEVDHDEDGNAWGCAGCPVRDRTGQPDCDGSPYTDWCVASADGINLNRFPFRATTPELVTLAQAELDFLRSLLPKDAP